MCAGMLNVSGKESDSSKKSSKNLSSISANTFESGKWVAVYMGSRVPEKCVCVKNIFRSQCMVGDFSSDTSLCE